MQDIVYKLVPGLQEGKYCVFISWDATYKRSFLKT